MKKSVKLSALLIAALLSVGSMAACNNSSDSSGSSTVSKVSSVNSVPGDTAASDAVSTAVSDTTTSDVGVSDVTSSAPEAVQGSSAPVVSSVQESSASVVSSVQESSVPVTSSAIENSGSVQKEKVSIKDYIENNVGDTLFQNLEKQYTNDNMSTKIYFGNDNQLVYEMTSTKQLTTSATQSQMDAIKETMDSYIKQYESLLKQQFSAIASENVADFDIVIYIKDYDGTEIYSKTIPIKQA